MPLLVQAVATVLLPFFLVGVVNRVKALWAGRKGPPLAQALYDVIRLFGKRPVVSTITTPVFSAGPSVLLATTMVASLFVPLPGPGSPASFAYDFVFVAYAMGLGRMAIMLSALDTGSAFEGMGASREATLAALAEPALFLVLASLVQLTGETSLERMLAGARLSGAGIPVVGCSLLALLVLLQVEAARVPVDDPNTHLELTMIHEVMVLDTSGPDLAMVQCAAALKLTWFSAALAALLNPAPPGLALLHGLAGLVLMVGVAVIVGGVESLVARLKLRVLPAYLLVAVIAGLVALLVAVGARPGGGP